MWRLPASSSVRLWCNPSVFQCSFPQNVSFANRILWTGGLCNSQCHWWRITQAVTRMASSLIGRRRSIPICCCWKVGLASGWYCSACSGVLFFPCLSYFYHPHQVRLVIPGGKRWVVLVPGKCDPSIWVYSNPFNSPDLPQEVVDALWL